MTHIARGLGRVLGLMTLATLLAACGGGSGSSGAAPVGGGAPDPVVADPPPPEVIEGVATPSSVSVVTATNTN